MRARQLLLTAACGLSLIAAVGAQSDRQLQLLIGDATRRNLQVDVVLDGITVTATRDVITPGDLPTRLEKTRLLLLGESHNSLEAHRVQLRVLQALVAAGRPLLLGLEMYPYTEQAALDKWNDGTLSEAEFLTASRWYEHWGYDWRYYRDIFQFARGNRIPVVAVNTPREVVTAVRKGGLKSLTSEQAGHLPPDGVDDQSADHMTFFRSSFDEQDQIHGGMSQDAWKNMLGAQATWDATMGWNAVQALKTRGTADTMVVVLVGSGHVAYDVGIVRQARRWFDGGIATLIPVAASQPETGGAQRVQASYADFVWGIPAETAATFPMLGVAVTVANGRPVVLQVTDDSPAARAGIKADDVLLSMDGQALDSRIALNTLIAGKQWGDAARLVVRRGAQELTLVAYFRRTA